MKTAWHSKLLTCNSYHRSHPMKKRKKKYSVHLALTHTFSLIYIFSSSLNALLTKRPKCGRWVMRLADDKYQFTTVAQIIYYIPHASCDDHLRLLNDRRYLRQSDNFLLTKLHTVNTKVFAKLPEQLLTQLP